MRIRIGFPRGEIFAELRDTPTAQALIDALPINSTASTWGEEVYFTTPVAVELESTARDVVDPGTVCFWVQGNALALPYGPTPASRADECRLVAKVNILGQVEGDPRELKHIRDGDGIEVSLADT